MSPPMSHKMSAIELEYDPLVEPLNIIRINSRMCYAVYPFFIVKFNILLPKSGLFRTKLGQEKFVKFVYNISA